MELYLVIFVPLILHAFLTVGSYQRLAAIARNLFFLISENLAKYRVGSSPREMVPVTMNKSVWCNRLAIFNL